MRAHGSKFGVKTRPQKLPETRECLWENQDFPSPKSDFPRSKFVFLQRLSDFREIRENLLQRLSNFFNAFHNGFLIFLNSFPLSSISSKYSYLEYFDFLLQAL
jgi:hypothetical protein